MFYCQQLIGNNTRKTVEKYIDEMENIVRLSENSITAYKTDLKEFCDFIENKLHKNNLSISERDSKLYLLYLNEKNYSTVTISRKLSAIRGFYKYLFKNNILRKNAFNDIHNPKIKRRLPETIGLDSLLEIYNLIEELESTNKAKLEKKILFDLLYGCALRVSEVCNLKVEDVSSDNGTIRVLGKGNKIRIIPLAGKTLNLIKEYLNIRDFDNQYLLLTKTDRKLYPKYVYRVVNRYLSLATNVKKKSPHILRHTAATHLLNNDADLMAVKEILGHENLTTTQIYTHVSIERLKSAYKKAHPKS